ACWIPRRAMAADEHRPRPIPHVDKIVHFGLFAVLGALAAPAGSRGRRVALTLAWGAALAVPTEDGQGTRCVGRDPGAMAAQADPAGVASASAIGAWRSRGRAAGRGPAGP